MTENEDFFLYIYTYTK